MRRCKVDPFYKTLMYIFIFVLIKKWYEAKAQDLSRKGLENVVKKEHSSLFLDFGKTTKTIPLIQCRVNILLYKWMVPAPLFHPARCVKCPWAVWLRSRQNTNNISRHPISEHFKVQGADKTFTYLFQVTGCWQNICLTISSNRV